MFAQLFKNRTEAGRVLAGRLAAYANRSDVVVLALPRGGVPVAFEVAQALHVPLDVFVVRKLGVPGHEELALGAIASGGVRVLNNSVIQYLYISKELIDQITRREQKEIERRERLYRGTRRPLEVRGRTVIVVDDGLATGSTMRAAVDSLLQQQPASIVVAVPVGAQATCDIFQKAVDTVCVCAATPEPFDAVGLWYGDFSQTTDEEVRVLLERAQELQTSPVEIGSFQFKRPEGLRRESHGDA